MQIWIRWGRNLFYLLVAAGLLTTVVIYRTALEQIWRQHVWAFLIAIGFMIPSNLAQSKAFLAFLSKEDSTPPILELMRIWAFGSLSNYLAPLQPGLAIRVTWLTRQGLPLSRILLATWGQFASGIWLTGLGLAVGLTQTHIPDAKALSAVLLATLAAAWWLRRPSSRWIQSWTKPRCLVNRKELVAAAAERFPLKGIFWIATQYGLSVACLFILYRNFGATLNVGQALFVSSTASLAGVIHLLPANLGISEGIYTFAGHELGMTVVAAAGLALLFRVAHIAASCLIAGSLSVLVLIKAKDRQQKNHAV